MPMSLHKSDPAWELRQTFSAPAIYFDHWAIRLFSDDLTLQDRLIELVHQRRATFVLSATNLAEFTHVSDHRHGVDSGRLLGRLMPNIYLTMPDLDLAERHHAEARSGGLLGFPPPDRVTLRFLADQAREVGADTPSIECLFSLMQREGQAVKAAQMDTSAALFATILSQRADSAATAAIRGCQLGDGTPPVLLLFRELARELHLQPQAPSLNDVVDMQHAMLPLLHCDFVLLDAAWVDRVARIAQRARRQNFDLRLPLCFSKRAEGPTRFLEALDGFTATAAPAVPKADR